MDESPRGSSSARTVPAAVDAALGVAAMATSTAVAVTRLLARAAAPIGRRVMHPPLLHERLHPARVVEALAGRGHVARTSTGADLSRIIAAVVHPLVDEVLDSLDLTALVRERVDIDALVSTVDIAAIIDRMDIDAILREVDIDGIVRQMDIDAIVSEVDIDAIAKRIDVDAIAEKIDIDTIVSRVDLDAIVRRLDLVAIAEEIVNGIDLPEIIRQSTGSMASDVVRDVRMESIDADLAIARLVDRMIRRSRARQTDAPGEPESRIRAELAGPVDVAPKQPPLTPRRKPRS